jgi:hypothetical protein
MRFFVILLAGLFCFATMLPMRALAQEAPKVINVLNIDTNGDQDAFLALIKRVEAIRERLGVPGTSRVWQATLAGEGTGSTFVAVEYPNLVAMAQSISKMGADEGWQQLVDDFQKAGMSVNSNSTSVEITP